ncbi:MAG: PrgI family protein [Patescibacteria group bacterium]|jgi:hypothetical protein
MQYKVPQNIDKEDEIVGPLTLVQFSYLAIAFAIDFLAFKSLPLALSLIIILPLSVLAFALAFLKIQDRPMLTFLMAVLHFSRDDKARVWSKTSDRPILQIDKTVAPVVATDATQHKQFDSAKAEALANVIDARGQAPAPATPEPTKMPFTNVDQNILKKND